MLTERQPNTLLEALQSGEMSSTNMATVMGWNTNLATLLINFIFNSINLLKKVAQAINLVKGKKKQEILTKNKKKLF